MAQLQSVAAVASNAVWITIGVFAALFALTLALRIVRSKKYRSRRSDRDDAEWKIRYNTVYEYRGNAARVVVPEGVTDVFSKAFYKKSVQTVVLPTTLRQMHAMAFSHCPNLQEVVLPQNFHWDEREEYFYESPRLSAVTYHGKRCTDFVIEDGTLLLCLVKNNVVETPQGIRRIGSRAFSSSSNRAYTQIRVSEGVREIGANAFRGISIKQIVLPSTVQTLAEESIAFCTDLRSVEIVGVGEFDGLLVLGDTLIAAFGDKECYVVPEGVKRIGKLAFSTALNCTQSIRLPDTLEYIGSHAFSFLPYVERLRIPQSVREIEMRAFEFWRENQTLEMPSRFRAQAGGDNCWNEKCRARIEYV